MKIYEFIASVGGEGSVAGQSQLLEMLTDLIRGSELEQISDALIIGSTNV